MGLFDRLFNSDKRILDEVEKGVTHIPFNCFPLLYSLFPATLPEKSCLSSCLHSFAFSSSLGPLQLGFCLLCPPEMALVEVIDDLRVVRHRGHVPILVLLDV